MNCLIAELIFLIIVFILLILFDKNKEKFFVNNSESEGDDNSKLGFFSIVDINAYDLEKDGPQCIAQCVSEHGANILFTNPNEYDPFDWNKKNPTKGFCYRANSNVYPFACDGDCEDKCGVDSNNPQDNNGVYDPEKDFSQCEKEQSGSLGCKERKLNFLSGQSCRTTIGCKKCINKYKLNLETLRAKMEEEYNPECAKDSKN